jgi:hypothetical protein
MELKQYATIAVGILLLASALPWVIAKIKAKLPSAGTSTAKASTVPERFNDQDRVLTNLEECVALLTKHGDVKNAEILTAMLPTVRRWGWIPTEVAK